MLFGNALDLNRSVFLGQPVRDDNEVEVPFSTYASSLLKIQKELMDKSRDLIYQQDKNHIATYDTKFSISSVVPMAGRTTFYKIALPLEGSKASSFIPTEFNMAYLITNKEQYYHLKNLKEFFCDPLLINPVDVIVTITLNIS
jgi:hypothetical protein